MKSLDIINNAIKKEEEVLKYGFLNVSQLIMQDLKQVKQDLEVLEIIKESHIGDDDIFIKFLIASYRDIDKYNKVKQWLEE